MFVAQPRPPFVEFKQVARPDPKASLEAGMAMTKNVNMAFIMQPGSRDQLEIRAEDWLKSIKDKMLTGAHDAYPPEWVDGFHKKFDLWRQGLESPLMGKPIREWPVASPAEVENCIAARILTVEDLANATEEALGKIGMGARALREKAREWLAAAADHGKSVERIAALESKIEDLARQNEVLLQKLAAVGVGDSAPAISVGDAPRRGRPPKYQQQPQTVE